MQFGPTTLKLASRAISVSCACRLTPSSSPVSAKPEVKNAAPPTFASIRSFITYGETCRGTATSA